MARALMNRAITTLVSRRQKETGEELASPYQITFAPG